MTAPATGSPPPPAPTPASTTWRWNAASLVAATVPLLLAWRLPLTTNVTTDSSGVTTETTRSLLAAEGPWLLAVLAVPVAVAAVPLMARHHPRAQQARIGAVIGLGVCVVLGAMTMGVTCIPALALAVVAASRGRRQIDQTRAVSPRPRPRTPA